MSVATEKRFADFILELEFNVDDGLNSGVQIRSDGSPSYRQGQVHGYQVEIDPSSRAWSGGLYEQDGRGWLFDLTKNEAARMAFRHNDWNRYRWHRLSCLTTALPARILAAALARQTRSGPSSLRVPEPRGRSDHEGRKGPPNFP